jgi:hypothetical protein
MSDQEELAELKARVAELEAKMAPPKPFVPEPFQRYDPTANFSMPKSVLEAMVAAVPDSVVKGIVAEQRTPSTAQGPSAAGTSGTPTKVHSAPKVAWSASGNSGRW